MTRFLSFMTIVLALSFCSTVSAQKCVDSLMNKAFKVGDIANEIDPAQWYILNQQRDGGGFMYTLGDGIGLWKARPQQISMTGTNRCKEKGNFLVRFIPTESQYDDCEYPTYYVQFGNGDYASEVNSEDLLRPGATTDINKAVKWNAGKIDDNEPAAFWFMKDDRNASKMRIDNDRFGIYSNDSATVVYWGQGAGTERGKNYDWDLYTIEFLEYTKVDSMKAVVETRYSELRAEYEKMEPGTDHGQYDPEAYYAFEGTLNEVFNALNDSEYVPTMEDLKEKLDAMNEAYENVKKTIIIKEYKPSSGYYFIKAAGYDYTETVVIPQHTDPETGEVVEAQEIVTPVEKAMYSNINGLGWKTIDADADASFLWRLDKDEKTGNYKFFSCATNGRFGEIARSKQAVFSDTISVENGEIKISYAKTKEDGTIAFAFSVANQATTSYPDHVYAHQGGHSSGKGKEGTIVGWNMIPNSGEGSWWALQPVDDATAVSLINEYGGIMDHDNLVNKYDSIHAIAVAKIKVVESRQKIATSVDQLSSEFTETAEGSLAGAIDGNYSTYWHSAWKAGSVAPGSHYIQIDALHDISDGAFIYYVRRDPAKTNNDHTTKFSLYGSHTGEEVTKEEWAKLGEWSVIELSSQKELISEPIKFEGSYQYFRIYSEETRTASNKACDRGYWHAAEINLLPLQLAENSQAVKMGALYTNLRAVLDEQEGISSAEINSVTYSKLEQALAAFETKYVDPSALRNAIKDAKAKSEYVVEGENPGYWSDLTAKNEADAIIADAVAYDESGDYTPKQSEAFIAEIKAKADAVVASVNTVRTDKWYKFQFPSEEMYDEHPTWDKNPSVGVLNDNGLYIYYPLYDRVFAIGRQIDGDDIVTDPAHKFAEPIGADEAYQGSQIVIDLEENLFDEDLALFRFIETEEAGKYTIQNKATGLFIKTGPKNTNVVVDMHPSVFKVTACGWGEILITGEEVDGTNNYYYLNSGRDGAKMISWNTGYAGSNSAFLIKEADDITTLPETTCLKQVVEGVIYPYTCATSYKVESEGAQIYTFKGITENSEYVFSPVNEAPAGTPTFMVADGEYWEPLPGEETEYMEITLSHGMEFVRKVNNTNGVVGAFAAQTAPKGSTVVDGATLKLLKSDTTLGANSAYIVPDQAEEVEARGFVITIGGTGEVVSIQDVLGKVAKSGAIYSIDGKMILEKGNINSINKLGKGTYILNGAKILVK